MSFSSKIIMGLDILPMSAASSKQKPKYAVIIVRGETTLFKSEEVSIHKLNKLIENYKPEILAIDNVWELAPDQESLQFLMEKFPIEITLVQVTGPPAHMQPIHTLAKRLGMQLASHPSPIKTAEICVNLVQIGIGSEVACFEKETQIKVSRTRAVGPGGQHQNKYRRHFHALILQATRDIQGQLDEHGIEYDLSVRKADYGLDKSVFTVYTAVSEVTSTLSIQSYHGSTIQVRIIPIKKKEIEFIPLATKEEQGPPLKSIIIGIDPGTTTGIAILDLNGNILALRSGKEISRRDIIRYISEFGSAVMMATDVSPLPKFVEKVATAFKSIIFSPQKSLKVVDKKELVIDFLQKHNMKINDAHIRDALACALKAYFSFQNTFEKIQKKIQELNVDVSEDKVKALVMRGYSIYDAISILTFDQENKEEEPTPEITETADKDKVEELNKKIYLLIDKNLELKRNLDELNTQNLGLEATLKDHKNQILNLQNQIERMKSKTFFQLKGERMIRTQDTEIARQRKEITNLQSEIDNLKTQIVNYEKRALVLEGLKKDQVAGKIVILKVIENFSKECIEKVELFPNDIVYMVDGSGGGGSTADQLVADNIRAIITNTLSHEAFEKFRNSGIVVIAVEEILDDLKMCEGIYYIDKKQLENKLKLYKQKQYAMNLQEAELWLQNLISNYRNRKDEDYLEE